MKKGILALAAGVLVAGIILVLSYRSNPYQVIDGFAQGTTFHIIYKPPFSFRYMFRKSSFSFRAEIDSLLRRVDGSLSIYQPGSLISRINRNDTTARVDKLLETVFLKSAEISRLTGGAFDITVGPLVNAWGFGPEEKKDVDSVLIDSLLLLVGMDKVAIVHGRVVKSLPGILLDVNAIAQGYTVDLVAEFLDARGITDYLVEIGGEIRPGGRKLGNKPWKVGVDKPVDNNLVPGLDLQVILQLENRSLATSGNYRKFYEEEGVKYVHSIDPASGYPVRHNLLSVSVLAENCMTADAFATAFMVLGFEESRKLVSVIPGLDAYFIYAGEQGEFRTYATGGFEELIVQE